jgi:hypothetical protein
MLSKQIFLTHFLVAFTDLQRDRTINVRMVISEVLALHYKKFSTFSEALDSYIENEANKKYSYA